MDRLAGKRALVTGAGRGIGAGIALAFAREGADVLVHYGASADGAEATAAAIRELGRRSTTLQAGLTDPAAAARLAQQAWETWDGIDILVCNAGAYDTRSILDQDLAALDHLLAVNVRSPFVLTRDLGLRMVTQGQGVIIGIGSGAAFQPRPGFETSVAYAASRAAATMLYRRLAIDLAPQVRVNVLVPGITDSKPRRWSAASREKYAARNLRRVPQQIDDVTPGAVFLASDEARFMTGEVLVMDGGTLAMGWDGVNP